MLGFEGLPKLSCDCTVSAVEHTPAVSVWTAVVKTSFEAAAGFTVSLWVMVAANEPLPVTVIVGDPAFVSL
jgi:hypothetical protein